ncbi:hypothetical protein SISSUDRAFT_1044339 [Sistotremastrum suecicum HHB10207 ss-3]|uniref:Uncharacterized protein n=1 Tax=Sistotremastrum suecicum HHB10207 ss-3 TaxID=1314776 RepID=A0A166F9K6_9AGAM|nr:hypothetical protein SISSUDRAFT_1044339 [Sistotremastrum suecicum HHB10207 ss-3]
MASRPASQVRSIFIRESLRLRTKALAPVCRSTLISLAAGWNIHAEGHQNADRNEGAGSSPFIRLQGTALILRLKAVEQTSSS